MNVVLTISMVLLCICCYGYTGNIVTLYPPENSNCAGVIQFNAKVKFTAVVDFTSCNNSWSKSVLFEFKPTSAATFTHLCVVNIQTNPCNYTSQLMCYCSRNTQEICIIVIIAPLYMKNSRAEIRGYVTHTDGQQWYSEVQRYPTFYNLSALNYTINGRSLQQDSNIFVLNSDESEITFCCRDLPSPCRANIKHQQELVASGEPCAVYNINSTHQQGNLNLTLAYDICKVTKEINLLFNCDLSKLTLTVNGRSLQPNSNVFELKNNESTITFCCRDLQSPCRANIKHQQELVASGEPCAVYKISSTHQHGSFNLTLAYDICYLKKMVRVLFMYDTPWMNNFVVVTLVITSNMISAILITVCYYFRAQINRRVTLDEPDHSVEDTVETLNIQECNTAQYSWTKTGHNIYETIIDDYPSSSQQRPLPTAEDEYLVIIDDDD